MVPARARARCATRGRRPGKRVYRRVDSCAGEVAAESNYYYSTFGEADEPPPFTDKQRVVIIGSGPNRIGQGIEFDYCCVHAAQSFRALGLRGDHGQLQPGDGLDRLRHLRPPLLRAARRRGGARGLRARAARGRRHPVRRPDAAQARARDRGRRASGSSARRTRRSTSPRTASGSARCSTGSGSAARTWGIAESGREAAEIAHRIGYPVLVRPSYVLGGRAMRVCYRGNEVVEAFHKDLRGRVLVDRFVENAIEIDVDALCDGEETYIAAVMQHVEEAGVHSGDSACVLPAPSLTATDGARGRVGRAAARARARDGRPDQRPARRRRRQVYVLEANPRASRTVPFASKATGLNLVEAACRLAAGAKLARARPAGRAAAEAGQRQGGGAPVLALPRRRSGARAGDALDRRGDGLRLRPADRVREGGARRGAAAADLRHGVPLGARRRQGCAAAGRRGARRARVQAGRDRRDRARAPGRRARGRAGGEGRRGRRGDGRRPDPPRQAATSSSTRRTAARCSARTATGSARRRSSPACRASRRSPAPRPPCTRSRTRAPSSPSRLQERIDAEKTAANGH